MGTVMIFEGAPYFISPEKMKKYLKNIIELSDEELRRLGLIAMLVGLVLVYIATRTA